MPKKCPHLYCETKNKKPFNWFTFLLYHYRKGTPEYRVPAAAAKRAKDWTTCACGNQCKIIPRYERGQWIGQDFYHAGAPIDPTLNELGVDFYKKVFAAKWLEAIGILTLIEQRSSILIQRELAKRAKRR